MHFHSILSASTRKDTSTQFITGRTKLRSTTNHLIDTFKMPDYAQLRAYTRRDAEAAPGEHLDLIVAGLGISCEQLRDELVDVWRMEPCVPWWPYQADDPDRCERERGQTG